MNLTAAIEEHHDERGILWPVSIAPFEIELITVNQKDEPTRQIAEDIYDALTIQGYDVLYDDRDERAGVKFKDADLIGVPLQVVLGERNLKEGKIELKFRASGETKTVPLENFSRNLSDQMLMAFGR